MPLIQQGQLTHLKRQYNIIMICLGGNDYLPGKSPEMAGADARELATECIISLIQYFQNTAGWLTPTGVVRFLLPPPRLDSTYKYYSEALYNRLRQDADLKKCIGKCSNWYTSDGSPAKDVLDPNDRYKCHMSEFGYSILNKYIIGVISNYGH